jgi:hypothetical protein
MEVLCDCIKVVNFIKMQCTELIFIVLREEMRVEHITLATYQSKMVVTW